MNNALNFINGLIGTSITFKPIEKGKDRPVNTITFNSLQKGQYGLEFMATFQYTTKGSTTPTTVTRILSVTRAMEYIAQASEQEHEQQPSAASTSESTDNFFAEDNIQRIEADTAAVIKNKKNKKQQAA